MYCCYPYRRGFRDNTRCTRCFSSSIVIVRKVWGEELWSKEIRNSGTGFGNVYIYIYLWSRNSSHGFRLFPNTTTCISVRCPLLAYLARSFRKIFKWFFVLFFLWKQFRRLQSAAHTRAACTVYAFWQPFGAHKSAPADRRSPWQFVRYFARADLSVYIFDASPKTQTRAVCRVLPKTVLTRCILPLFTCEKYPCQIELCPVYAEWIRARRSPFRLIRQSDKRYKREIPPLDREKNGGPLDNRVCGMYGIYNDAYRSFGKTTRSTHTHACACASL